MMIFVDFDDVLFNTKKFRLDLKKKFLDFGVTEAVFERYYKADNLDQKPKTYSPFNHLRMIEEGEDLDLKGLKSKLEIFLSDLGGYLFSDSLDFLKKFGSDSIFVISFGESVFQRNKIAACRMQNCCQAVEVIEDSKAQAIGKILADKKSSPIFFIDDRVEFIRDVKKNLPEIQTILLQRPEGRYQDTADENCDFVAGNLKEVEGIIRG